MDLINQFIENYKKKLTFYENLGRISSSQLEDALQSAGIRAMVTYRIKNPGRLKSKILRRNVKRTVPYKNMKEIYEDIADLCGIRVSLYFPGDRIKSRLPDQRSFSGDRAQTVPGTVQTAYL